MNHDPVILSTFRSTVRFTLGNLCIALFALCLAGCPSSGSSGDSGETDDPQPWLQQFMFGNFAVNTASVLTTQDGISDDYLSDYVNASALPNANLEVFSVNAYLPDSDTVTPRVESATVTPSRMGGASLGDVYKSSELVEHTTLDGQSYTVYRITGMYVSNTAPLTAASFANVVFELQVVYEQDGVEAQRLTRTIEVYKR